MSSSYDNGTLNVGTLGFPSSGYILGINATGGVYMTNTTSQVTSTIPLTYLTSLTSGPFLVGTLYPMTAVFSANIPSVSSITITPPNATDTIASASVSTNTLTFNWTPVVAVSSAPFSFVFGFQTIQSANLTTVTSPTTMFIPSGFAVSGGTFTQWNDTKSVCSYGGGTYSSTNTAAVYNGVGSYSVINSAYDIWTSGTMSVGCKFMVAALPTGSTLSYVVGGNGTEFWVNSSGTLILYDSATPTSVTITPGTWYSLAVGRVSGTSVTYLCVGTNGSSGTFTSGIGTGYPVSIPWIGGYGSNSTDCQIQGLMYWNNYCLNSAELTQVTKYLNAL